MVGERVVDGIRVGGAGGVLHAQGDALAARIIVARPFLVRGRVAGQHPPIANKVRLSAVESQERRRIGIG